jgi:hypothetical protein
LIGSFPLRFGLISTVFRRTDNQEIIAPNALLASSKLIRTYLLTPSRPSIRPGPLLGLTVSFCPRSQTTFAGPERCGKSARFRSRTRRRWRFSRTSRSRLRDTLSPTAESGEEECSSVGFFTLLLPNFIDISSPISSPSARHRLYHQAEHHG